jgi:adenosylcobinamide-GDP ribazoletransferase
VTPPTIPQTDATQAPRTWGPRSAFAILTVIGNGASPTPKALPWFAPVGLIIGALTGAITVGLHGTPLLAGAIALGCNVAITGALHIDGLADSADGLLPHATTERRLAIMKTPDVGAFGLAVVVITLLVAWASLATIASDVHAVWDEQGATAVGAIVLASVAARVGMALTLKSMRPARPGGLSAAFQSTQTTTRSSLLLALLIGLCWGAAGLLIRVEGWDKPAVEYGLPIVVVMVGLAVVVFAGRRIGGYTGDVLGAQCVISETIGWVLAAVVLHHAWQTRAIECPLSGCLL